MNNKIQYFNLNKISEDLKRIVEEEWFVKCVKEILNCSIPWNNIKDRWWDDFCRIEVKRKEKLLKNLESVENFEQAYMYLKDFSFPELSPIEDPEKYKDKEYYDSLVEERKTQIKLINKAKSKYDIEWYILLHNCQILNGSLTYNIMKRLYPEVKWELYSSALHTFVSNVRNTDHLEYMIKNNESSIKIDDINENVICDMFWYFIDEPIKNIFSKPNQKLQIHSDIKKYLMEQFCYEYL